MKKLLLIALLLTFTAGSAVAQQQGGPGSPPGSKGQPANSQAGNRGSSVDRLTERLGLDEDQAAQIALIFEDAQQLRDEERELARLASEEQRAITHEQIMDVLTDDQKVLFEELRQQREELRQALEDVRADRGFGGGGRGPGTGDCNN